MLIAFLFIVGLYFLYLGADYLIKGALDLGKIFKINSAFLGIFVLGFGTSLPELIVSIQSALSNNLYISYGNIIGSNIINIFFILSLIIVIGQVKAKNTTKYDSIFLVVSNLAFIISINFFKINYFISILLLIIVSYYMIISYKINKKAFTPEKNDNYNSIFLSLAILAIGFILLFLGANALVEIGVAIAQNLGVSEKVIGVTLIALGTSLPELATSIISTIKKQNSLAVFNIIGSNIFNVTIIPGISGLITNFSDTKHLFLLDTIFYLLALILALLVMQLYKNTNVPKFLGILGIIGYLIYNITLLS